MATYSSILAWRISWTEEPGRLYSTWGHKESDMTEQLSLSLRLGRKAMTNLDGILKSRDVTLPTKVRIVKATVFPVVMYE